MFTNATLLSLYADARRADDLRPRRARPVKGRTADPRSRLARLFRRREGRASPRGRDPREALHAPAS